MEQTYLGRSGLVASELCLGTMTFGGQVDLDTARKIVEQFRDAGGTFFDTADVYTEGRSEETLGELVASYRDEVVIATKAYGGVGPGPNDRSASRRHLVQAVEASLRRLGTDYIDLYQIHAFDRTTPLDETLETLEDLTRAGKILYAGVSNFVGWQIERACRLQEARGFSPFVSLRPQYSLVERQIEFETLPAAGANNLGILAWSPLAAGFLTGKYRRDGSSDDPGRFAQFVDQHAGLNGRVKFSDMVAEFRKAKKMLRDLYEYYMEHIEDVFKDVPAEKKVNRHNMVCDFIAGMTDRFAMATYERIFLPQQWMVL